MDDEEIRCPPTTHLVATVDDLTDMLNFDSEDIDGMDEDAGDEQEPAPTVMGNVAEIQNFPTCHQDLSMERPATRGRRVHLHTLVDRYAEAFKRTG